MGHMPDDKWEKFARDDAEFYIYSVDVDFASPEGRVHFFDTGHADVHKILNDSSAHIKGWGLAIEIGCGTGRLAISMASRFERVIGVDISPTMLKKLETNCEEFGVGNVKGLLDTSTWENEGEADFVYSYLVFQHIVDFGVIERYFARIAKALGPKGVCYAQFDTRPSNIAYKVRSLLPDVVLPRTSKRGIRRVRRRQEDLVEMFSEHELEVISTVRPHADDQAFLLTRVHS